MLKEDTERLLAGDTYEMWLNYPMLHLRYIGYSAEDQDDGIIEPDWFSIAWVSLLQCLPEEYIVRIINTPDFPAQASHVKYYIVKAEAEEYIGKLHPRNHLTIEEFNGNIVLVNIGRFDDDERIA
jgi:hypothetical protein